MKPLDPTIDDRIGALLKGSLYDATPAQRQETLLPLFRARIEHAAATCAPYSRYVAHWPIPLDEAATLAELPYLPVSVFKQDPPLSCLPADAKVRTIVSSATTGQAPSRIVVDTPTAKAMARGAAAILKDYIGPGRRPLLIVDAAQSNNPNTALSARGAAIRALMPFATKTDAVLRDADQLDLDLDALQQAAASYGDQPVLIYGFTYVLWFHFAEVLRDRGVTLSLPNAHILHSGGWKKLIDQAVAKEEFNAGLAEVVGCPPENVIDFYGMVENIGVVYPDCTQGNKHAPAFADVLVRDPLTLAPLGEGHTGIIQVASVLPTSFPGHVLLTEDLATVIHDDHCPCGRRGLAFRLNGRIPKSETRGCGNVIAQRRGTHV